MAEETTTPGVSAENAAENLNFIEQEIKKDLEAGKNGGSEGRGCSDREGTGSLRKK